MAKKKLYKKAFGKNTKGKSFIWRSFFYISVTVKVIKWLFSKAQPKVDQQIDLEPGEYKIKVDDPKVKSKK